MLWKNSSQFSWSFPPHLIKQDGFSPSYSIVLVSSPSSSNFYLTLLGFHSKLGLVVSLELDYPFFHHTGPGTRSICTFSFSYLLWLDQCPPQVCVQLSLESSPSYVLASVPSPAPSDRSSGALSPECTAELRSNEVDYIVLDNIDPSATEDKVHDLLLQAIQGALSAGYHWLSSLSMPELTTPPPMQANAFPDWEVDLYIPDADKTVESTGLKLISSAKTFHMMTTLSLAYTHEPIFPPYVNIPTKQLLCLISLINLLLPLHLNRKPYHKSLLTT